MGGDSDPRPELGTCLHDLADIISSKCPNMGFALLMFDFGDQGAINYISNANPGDMAAQFRRIADRLDEQADSGDPGYFVP